MISFADFDNPDMESYLLYELNKIYIKFIIDFIKNSVNNSSNNNIEKIFSVTKCQFLDNIKSLINENDFENHLVFSNKKNNLKIEYSENIREIKIYLYGPWIKLGKINLNKDHYIDYIKNLINEIINIFNIVHNMI